MRILIAPDKFKGSLGAEEVGQCIAAGLRTALPGAELEIVALADGGEGTAAAICRAAGGEWIACRVHDALGREIEARYVWLAKSGVAVCEMSAAAGLAQLPPNDRNPLRASTFGVGEMLLAASGQGATEIIVGLGGSATNDGGFGLARALGFRFFAHDGRELAGPVDDLLDLLRIASPDELSLPRITAACDVNNPLLGPHGATRTFGPQKGATPEQLDILERSLARLAEVAARAFHCDHRDTPGAGAAGGLGFGLLAFCMARIRSGFEVVAEATGLRSKIERADIVITGEGKLDRQTLTGKGPAGVAQLARSLGKPVFAIVGQAAADAEVRELFDGCVHARRPERRLSPRRAPPRDPRPRTRAPPRLNLRLRFRPRLLTPGGKSLLQREQDGPVLRRKNRPEINPEFTARDATDGRRGGPAQTGCQFVRRDNRGDFEGEGTDSGARQGAAADLDRVCNKPDGQGQFAETLEERFSPGPQAFVTQTEEMKRRHFRGRVAEVQIDRCFKSRRRPACRSAARGRAARA